MDRRGRLWDPKIPLKFKTLDKDPGDFDNRYKNLKLFLLWISLVGKKKDFSWYLGNGCSHHMTRERYMLLDLRIYEGLISFGGNGKVGKDLLPIIDNVIYVEGLKYNLLSSYDIHNNITLQTRIYFVFSLLMESHLHVINTTTYTNQNEDKLYRTILLERTKYI
ncbi:hypothetical protein CR513_51633, partial [Mucuna pruriens]